LILQAGKERLQVDKLADEYTDIYIITYMYGFSPYGFSPYGFVLSILPALAGYL